MVFFQNQFGWAKPNLANQKSPSNKQKLDLAIFSIFFHKKGFNNSIIFMIKDNFW